MFSTISLSKLHCPVTINYFDPFEILFGYNIFQKLWLPWQLYLFPNATYMRQSEEDSFFQHHCLRLKPTDHNHYLLFNAFGTQYRLSKEHNYECLMTDLRKVC